MMSLKQVYDNSFGQPFPVLKEVCLSMDRMEKHLEQLRNKLGFQQDWSPYYDRKVRSGSSDAITWADKFGRISGRGDIWPLIGEICAWADTVQARLEEAEEVGANAAEGYPVAPVKRGPGRPRKVA